MASQDQARALAAAGIRVDEVPRGSRLILPRRDLGPARKAGWLLVIFGLFITAFMLFWMSGPISSGLRHPQGIGLGMILFGLLGLPGLAVGLGVLLIGLAVTFNLGHSEIHITPDRLRAIEVLGPFRLGLSRRLDDLRRFGLTPLKVTGKNGVESTPFGADAMLLRAEGPGSRFLLIAPGYPAGVLEVLAHDLSLRVPAAASPRTAPVPLPVVVETPDGEVVGGEPPVEKPARTTISFQDVADGFAITVPPAGLWRGSKGLFFFALLWNGFVGAFMVVALRSSSGAGAMGIFLFLSLFAAIGIGILLLSIHMGRMRTLIVSAKGRLALRRISPLRRKEETWAIPEILAVRIGPSGMEVNDRPVPELQIHLRSGRKVGLLAERSDEEIRWLAWLIRQRLNVPAQA